MGIAFFQDVVVFAAELFGDIGGEEFFIGAADDILEAFAHGGAEAAIGEGESGVGIFAEDVLGEGFDEAGVERLGGAEGFFEAFAFGDIAEEAGEDGG